MVLSALADDHTKARTYCNKRVRTPTVIQMEAVECGAAALAIVLGYYKKFIPLEELRDLCGVSRDGSNALKIIKAAQALGVEATGIKSEIEGLYDLEFPLIVFWNFNHFLVVEGIKKNKVYINDPASGPRVISLEEFSDSFTGVTITLKPGKDFEPSGNPHKLISALKPRMYGIKNVLIYLFILGLMLLLPGLAIPTFTRVFIDDVLTRPVLASVGGFFFVLFLTMAMAGALTWLQQYFLNRLNSKLSLRLSSQFFWHMLRLPIRFYSQRYSGEISNRLQMNDTVVSKITGLLATTFINFILVIFYALVMLQFNVTITCIAIAAAAVNILVLFLINRARTDAYACLQQDLGKSLGVAAGALRNIETIKSVGLETDFFSRWAGYYSKAVVSEQDIGIKDVILVSVPHLMNFLTVAALLTIGSWEVMEGPLTIGILMAMQVLMMSFLAPFSQFVNLGETMQVLKGDLNRLDDVLHNETDPILNYKTDEEDRTTKIDGCLTLEDVSFGYDLNMPPFIEDFNLHIKPGYSVALVGPSGCGKTTLAKLMTNLMPVWGGKILYDEHLPEEMNRKLFVRSLATVDQRIFIFEGSIRDNIVLWDPAIVEKDLVQAAKDACIHDDIIARNGGYRSMLSEGGRNLSGGQRQRIEIARSLVRNPSILILDEATSALDSETEKYIMRNIRRRGCTCVLIAHRLSTIRDCDEIIVLDQGKIQQRGSHDELKRMPGLYQELIKLEGS